MRTIVDHHDGFGLNEACIIEADEPGPGGASHKYTIRRVLTEEERIGQARRRPTGETVIVAEIQFQKGPRTEHTSTPGCLESALLAIVVDRMASFNAGPFSSRENAVVKTHCEDAMNWLWRRAKSRVSRGVLGTMAK